MTWITLETALQETPSFRISSLHRLMQVNLEESDVEDGRVRVDECEHGELECQRILVLSLLSVIFLHASITC